MSVPRLGPVPVAPAAARLPQAPAAEPARADAFETMLGTLRGTAEGFLGNGRDGDAPALPPAAAAEMFNESGLFGRAVDAPGASPAAPIIAEDAAAAGVAVVPVAAGPEGVAAVTRTSEVAAPVRPVGFTPAAASARSAVQSPPITPARPATISPAPGRVRSFEAATAESTRGRRPAEQAPSERSASAVQVALQPGADGLAVVARAQRLSRDEQLRLRVAIDALLARHGLVARRVTINGGEKPRGGSEGE